MVNILSRVAFGLALMLSFLLTFLLLGTASNLGFGQVVAGGPVLVLIACVMLINPFVFGLLGFFKTSPRWRLIAAGAMVALLLLYGLFVLGYFGPIGP